MRRSIAVLIFLDLAFLLLLSLSGICDFAGEVLYFLAFILPIALGLAFYLKIGEKAAVTVKKERILHSIPFFAPTLLLIIGISAVTSYLLAMFGKSNVTDVSGKLWVELLQHALLPAVLEEILFRFIPVKLLGKRSPRAVMLVSPIFFALIHLNLFQIPYALFAGSMLAFLTLATGSVFPAILLHLINNTISVIWMRNPGLTLPIIIIISAIAAISLAFIFIRRRVYAVWMKEISDGERIGFCPELIAVTVIMLVAAILNLR